MILKYVASLRLDELCGFSSYEPQAECNWHLWVTKYQYQCQKGGGGARAPCAPMLDPPLRTKRIPSHY